MASSHKNIPDQAFDALVTAEARQLAAIPRPDVQAALGEFREKRINLANPPVASHPVEDRAILRQVPPRFWPAVAAAAVILVAALAIVSQLPSLKVRPLSNNASTDNTPPAVNTPPAAGWTTVTATAPGRTETLPDGSSIQLASQSSISYPANFNADRQIRLSGDAAFNVTHNPSNPFRVQTKDITITVLGTSFSITTITGQTNVAVREGLIEVSRNQHRIRVAAHEALTIPHDTGSWQKTGDTTIKPVPPGPAVPSTSVQPATPAHSAALQATSPKDTLDPSSPAKPSSSARPARAITVDEEQDSHFNAMRAILADLVSEHCVSDRESITSATLTPEALIVNDVVQPNYLFEKFKAKYLDNSGNGYFYGSVHITGRGYFFNKSELDAPPRHREPKTRYDSLKQLHPN